MNVVNYFFFSDSPCSDGDTADVAGDAELSLEGLGGGDDHLEVVEHDDVGHPQAAGVVHPGPGPVVRAVEETVREEDEVARHDLLTGDLHDLPLLHQLPAWPDELKVPQSGLEMEELLEAFLPEK